jgi:hypothetical protein
MFCSWIIALGELNFETKTWSKLECFFCIVSKEDVSITRPSVETISRLWISTYELRFKSRISPPSHSLLSLSLSRLWRMLFFLLTVFFHAWFINPFSNMNAYKNVNVVNYDRSKLTVALVIPLLVLSIGGLNRKGSLSYGHASRGEASWNHAAQH